MFMNTIGRFWNESLIHNNKIVLSLEVNDETKETNEWIGIVSTMKIFTKKQNFISNENITKEINTKMTENKAEIKAEMRENKSEINTKMEEIKAEMVTIKSEIMTEMEENKTQMGRKMNALMKMLKQIKKRSL